ncbi:glycosyltransferase family 4 protein [soil metagenome]
MASQASTGRPRVAYLGHSAALSGGEIALARLLEARPHVEPFVVLAEHGPLVERLRSARIDTIVLPLASTAARVDRSRAAGPRATVAAVATLRYAVRLRRLVRSLRADVVHTNSMKAHLYGGVAARLAGIPHVWHARDRAAHDYLPAAVVHLVRGAARVLPDVLIANSASTLRTYPGVRDARVVHDAAPAHIRRAPTPAGGPLRIGMVGRLAPWKGQDVFLRAFAAAFPNGPQHAVVIGAATFGEDGYAASLRQLATDLGIEHRVTFEGHVDDVPAQLDTLHVLVHSSVIPEPFGQVVVEGMAAGLPVVAAAAGGPAEVIDDGRTGLLTAPGDVEALAATLMRLAGDEALRDRLGGAARTASARFLPQHVAGAVVDVYDDVLRRHGHAQNVAMRVQDARGGAHP